MGAMPMPADEVDVAETLVRALRPRAWVMLPALAGVRYCEKSVPAFSERSRRHLEAVLGEADVQTTR
jgi:hypothetical protein